MDQERPMIYFDNNATTQIDPRVLAAMMPYLTSEFGNAASNHAFGVNINQSVKEARAKIAELIGCDGHEIIFTSGATEAINLAIKGLAENHREKGKHIVTVVTEHPAVLDTCRYLERQGYEITYLPVGRDGLLDMDNVRHSIREDTILVSVMLVNNEIGVIQRIEEIAEIAHAKGAFFMTDATQAVGKIPVLVNKSGIDLMSFSGHKFYGPKGVGALYVRSKRPNNAKLNAIIHGGGHEKGLRSGTLNVPGIVGIGQAAEIAKKEMQADAARISKIRDHLESGLLSIEGTSLNGHPTQRLYNTTNICFKDADADAMIIDLHNIMVSNGSACTSTSVEPSHVLMALGHTERECFSSLRLSLGRFNTEQDTTTAIQAIKGIVADLRMMDV
jgi:cysteine desulfurase